MIQGVENGPSDNKCFDFLVSMAPRSVNTVETYFQHRQKLMQNNKSARVPPRHASALLKPCVNLQIDDKGTVNGVITRISPTFSLKGLDLLTEDIFRGISIVRLGASVHEINKLLANATQTQDVIRSVCYRETNFPSLSEIIPVHQGCDFVWANNTCTLKGGDAMTGQILNDIKNNEFSFYDACEIPTINPDNSNETIDYSYRDACEWNPMLCGSIGIYQQRLDKTPGLFLVCESSVSNMAGEVTSAIKADIMEHCNCGDFAESKELYFLENFSRRNRLRLIAQVAMALKIPVKTQVDIMAHESQRKERIAVEACGITMESLYALQDSENETFVYHAKGCVDISTNTGNVPVWSGSGNNLLIFKADAHRRSFEGIENDCTKFLTKPSDDGIVAFPVENISEDSLENVERIEREFNTLPKMSMYDLALHAKQYHGSIRKNDVDVMSINDNFGEFLFTSTRYDGMLPIVLHPKIHRNYEHVKENFLRNEGMFPKTNMKKKKFKKKPSINSYSPAVKRAFDQIFSKTNETFDYQSHLFDYEEMKSPENTGRVMFSWDDTTINFIDKFLMCNTEELSTSVLEPLLCVSSKT